MVPTGNKAKRLSLVNHTTKTIHHHHQDTNQDSELKKHLKKQSPSPVLMEDLNDCPHKGSHQKKFGQQIKNRPFTIQ